MNGYIKTKVDGKNFGFIVKEGAAPTDKDIFFHAESLVGVSFDELVANQDKEKATAVTFDMKDTDRGPAASNVQRV